MSTAMMDFVAAKAADIQAKSSAAFDVAISKNPDRVRAMLKLWFVPDFKPTFYDDRNRYSSDAGSNSGLDDIELLDPSYSSAIAEPGGQEVRFPVRMVDLDTGNLVEYPDLASSRGQYCILSHSWKGREITYKYLTDAAFKAYSRRLAVMNDNATPTLCRQSDIDLAKSQCRLDLAEQEKRIRNLASENNVVAELGLDDSCDVVEELLSRRVDVQILKKGQDGRGGLESARTQLAKAITARDHDKMEGEVFRKLLGDIGLDGDKIDTVLKAQPADLNQVVEMAEQRVADELKKASEETEKVHFFERYGYIREAVDEMIGCVQLCKSAVKIESAMERSKDVFDNNPFSRTEKRYLWIDTCCINRADDGEYAKSISAMGEWYKNAEFCLIHLDTARDIPQDSLVDWKALKSSGTHPRPNITTFANILDYEPQWSTRAWTLQELVMSKSTFYANSTWGLLSRPVERLGLWYYLSPFVSLYVKIDTNNIYSAILEQRSNFQTLAAAAEESDSSTIFTQTESDDETILLAQKLIRTLDALDLRIPRDIDMQTARPRIAQSIYVVVSRLTAPSQDRDVAVHQLVDRILKALEPFSSTDDSPRPVRIRHAINIVLHCIANLVEKPIQDDKQYIAAFGNVPGLDDWLTGLTRSNFSTHESMALVCPRDATVMTDKAYCLMGMLGVRFPTFHAEGLTKALSRLLDEVVITSNDVSVFNWTGKQYGSPIRGRSLYPSTPDAYRLTGDETRKKQKDEVLAKLLQIDRYETTSLFLAIQGMLLEVIVFAKDSRQKNLPLLWIKEILRVMKRRRFEMLKPHIINIGKILKYIQITFDSKPVASSDVGSPPAGHESEKTPGKQGSPLPSPSLGSLQAQMKIPSLPRSMPSFTAPRLGRKKTEAQDSSPAPSPPATSKRGFGGFKASSLTGLVRGDSGSSQPTSETPTTETATDRESDEMTLASPSSPPSTPSVIVSDRPTHMLDDEVLSYIRSIEGNYEPSKDPEEKSESPGNEPKLPAELEEVLADIAPREFSQPHTDGNAVETMISPNPIIVKNSGIEGSFDIQRVIVSMVQPEKLRRQIRNAASPTQQISGWCTVSTGFAMVLVSFSCPRRILEKELDVVQAVESKVLAGHSGSEDTADDDDPGDGEDAEADGKTDGKARGEADGRPGAPKRSSTSRGIGRIQSRLKLGQSDKEEDLGKEMPDFAKVKEEGARVSRMIKFVQESSLTSIAGEWVLARFSGVHGARWFLCYLELGASGRDDFYGHRIPTDEIDFRNAAPERGLLKYWEYYMMEKKHLLCSVLQKLMESKDWGRLKTDLANAVAGKATRAVAAGDDSDGSDSEEGQANAGISDTLKDLSAMALKAAGAGLMQKFYEWRAERLEKNLSAQVLKQFPTHMQAALESLDDNKDLMPSMFHSAKKVHMF
ncbi:hypothetical protein F4780DRAFT_71444 [Xylariomycetidae sp. FL0641]|nr:hypothetical protein F4780DRAFT_71444 [Xylariomycetidae sp. FL0641]